MKVKLHGDAHVGGNHFGGAGAIPALTAPAAGASTEIDADAAVSLSTVAEAVAGHDAAAEAQADQKLLAKQLDEFQNAMKGLEFARRFGAHLNKFIETPSKQRLGTKASCMDLDLHLCYKVSPLVWVHRGSTSARHGEGMAKSLGISRSGGQPERF